jgi:hypothetical protein
MDIPNNEDTSEKASSINPFGAPEGLEWVDDLVRSGFGQTIPPHREIPISASKAVTICMADVQSKPISWLWPGRIALGKLTLISGDPGLGKSLLTATMAATVSKGYKWPLTDSVSPVGQVVLLSAEDDPGDTIRPRLDAAGADCKRIHILQAIRDVDSRGNPAQRMFSLQSDLVALEELLPSIPDCHLLIIDPISAYLDGAESHNNSDVRGLLAPLAKLASDQGIAIVLVQHLNKNSSSNAMYRAIGSIAFVAAARASYIVTKDQNNPERRLVVPVKNNLAKDNTGLAYSVVEAENGAPVIVWETEPVTMTADEALAPSESDKEKTGTDWAEEVLLIVLAGGPIPAIKVQKEAEAAGISKKELRMAQKRLGIKPKKADFKGGWEWSLPQHEDALKDEGVLPKNEGILGTKGHLGDETKNIVVSEPQNGARVTLPVGGADSVLFSDK